MVGLPIITTAIIAFYQLRVALFVLFSLIYLGAYPVLQFDPRHYFYLEFIGWWFIGFLGQQIIFLIKNRFDSELLRDIQLRVRLRWKGIFIAVVAGWAILFGFLILLRFYQTNYLGKLYNNYLSLKTKTIAPVLSEENKFIVKLPVKAIKQTSYLDTIYLKIKIREKCPLNQISLKLHYLEEPPKSWEAPQELIIPTNKTMTYFIPIYNYHNGEDQTIIDEAYIPSYWIDYLEYSLQDSFCVKNIAYLKEIERIPLLLTLKLKMGWENSKLYQSFQEI